MVESPFGCPNCSRVASTLQASEANRSTSPVSPAQMIRGARCDGKAPSSSIPSRIGAAAEHTASSAHRVSAILSCRTWPRNFKVTWILRAVTQLIPHPGRRSRRREIVRVRLSATSTGNSIATKLRMLSSLKMRETSRLQKAYRVTGQHIALD